MPPRDEPLPEGTDQIIDGAAKTDSSSSSSSSSSTGGTGSSSAAGSTSGSTGGSALGSSSTGGGLSGSTSSGSGGGGQSSSGGSALVATGSGDDTGGTAGNNGSSNKVTDKLVAQVKDQVTNLRGQAGEKLRGFADTGKGRTETLLDDLQEVINDAARAVEQRFGGEYADYARQAATAVNNLNGKLREKSVDDLLDDTRDLVRKSPGMAVGIAAVAGFALVRILKTGLEDVGAGRTSQSGASNAKTGDGA